MIKNISKYSFFLFTSVCTWSQIQVVTDSVKKPEIKLSFLDSLKTTYVVDEMSSCVDSLWLKNVSTESVYNEMIADIKNINLDQPVDYELPTAVLKERLRLMDEKSPFNIEYNVGLENVIKSFLKNRKKSFERLMGVSQYYFPMFEEAMAKYNVPLEIKYLAIVESALNPKAVSRMGATGLWQFMYETGKQYKLNINSYVDERSDPLKASDAAGRYMQGMYKIFGDWELVLASYNSGAGNVSKAIRRSGGYQNFWNIKKHLPRETQGYVPAFLATMYIFEFHKEHGIVPQKTIVNHLKTDTIAVKKKMSFAQISDLLDIPLAEIEFLNPSYKMKVVPYITKETHFLRLPIDKIAVFTSNEDKMYAYVNYQENKREKQFENKPKVVKDSTVLASVTNGKILEEAISSTKTITKTKIHKVKRGDNLSDIADKYNVSMAEIKSWNRLRSSKVQTGTRLKILSEKRITIAQKTDKNLEEKKSINNATTEVIAAKPNEIKEYIVKTGDNLTKIAKENKLYVADLKKWNNLKDNNVNVGDVLKLAAFETTENNTESVSETIFYTVKKGDNITKIAELNQVSIVDLKGWNKITDNNVRVGEKLIIETHPQGIAEIKKGNRINTVFEDFKTYIVQKGDSLYSISQKHHTTVADIKKQNNIQDENLQPGMKLKI